MLLVLVRVVLLVLVAVVLLLVLVCVVGRVEAWHANTHGCMGRNRHTTCRREASSPACPHVPAPQTGAGSSRSRVAPSRVPSCRVAPWVTHQAGDQLDAVQGVPRVAARCGRLYAGCRWGGSCPSPRPRPTPPSSAREVGSGESYP